MKPVCNACHCEGLLVDARAEWSESENTWVLHSVYDETYCPTCDEVTSKEWINE